MLYLYGIYNPKATLWANRYFLVIYPCVIIIIGYAIDNLVNLFGYKSNRIRMTATVMICCMLLPYFYNKTTTDNYKDTNYYRECGEWIYSQINYVYNEDTIVFVTSRPSVAEAFHEYYMTKQSQRDDVNWVYPKIMPSNYSEYFLQYNTIILCNYYSKGVISDKILNFINKNYTLVESNKDLNLGVYVKKTEE